MNNIRSFVIVEIVVVILCLVDIDAPMKWNESKVIDKSWSLNKLRRDKHWPLYAVARSRIPRWRRQRYDVFTSKRSCVEWNLMLNVLYGAPTWPQKASSFYRVVSVIRTKIWRFLFLFKYFFIVTQLVIRMSFFVWTDILRHKKKNNSRL